MTLNNKLKGLPKIYYFNLDHKTDRRKYMETQFENWGIKNYTRVSSTKYLGSEVDKWAPIMISGDTSDTDIQVFAHSIIHFDIMKEWLRETDEDYILLMEDDYDLGIIEYWHFDWEYLMNKLPYDWDCIQLGYETTDVLSFYLHPIKPEYSFGPCLMRRSYVEKLLNLHCDGEKYRFDFWVANNHWNYNTRKEYKNAAGSSDYFMCQSGKTYSIPLIALNPYFTNWYYNGDWIPKAHFQMCYDTYYDWWKYDRDRFTLDEFFTYGKPNDNLMQRIIQYCDDKYFAEKAKKCRHEFLKNYEFK